TGGTEYQLSLKNSIIENSSEKAVTSINSSLYAENCLFGNNGQTLSIEQGGMFSLVHCTLASYSSAFIHHREPSVFISDSFEEGAQGVSEPVNVIFENCVIWGDGGLSDEVLTDKKGSLEFKVLFTNCIARTNGLDPLQEYQDCFLNMDPIFLNTDNEVGPIDFHLSSQSPAIDNGRQTTVTTDLDNRQRVIPDLGCFEFAP
ncbi:MAG TPA: choice-of-anchor Q domain-containing protein, partial [Flavitalea sp.]|nr:choice-of-anchor Q domain-containing protein [Flavitalea sp.]